MSVKLLCSECVKKQELIDQLKDENKRLKAKIRRLEQGPFGSSTPSSRQPVKANTKNDSPRKNGGARIGHQGNGRRSHPKDQADHIEPIECKETICPDCQIELERMGARGRSVLGVEELKVKKILYLLHRRRCPLCNRIFSARAPEVLPKFLLNNELLTHCACEHYIDGIPLGLLEQKLNIHNGTLINSMHYLANLLKPIIDRLIEQYRQSLVKFADESVWRNDGHNGYAWLFSTALISIYRIRATRSASIVTEVLGTEPLPGVLVVDRYNGYNRAPCQIQYCYEHLRRLIEDLIKEFPQSQEVTAFVDKTVPLLKEAMGLRSQKISDAEFYQQAQQIKANIIYEMNQPAQHAAIQNIQFIFQKNSHRLYHWAENRDVPAENNFSERGFRRLVIARKISFGSQSDHGAETREILMTVLHTLRKRHPFDYRQRFKNALNEFAQNPSLDLYQLIFSSDSS